MTSLAMALYAPDTESVAEEAKVEIHLRRQQLVLLVILAAALLVGVSAMSYFAGTLASAAELKTLEMLRPIPLPPPPETARMEASSDGQPAGPLTMQVTSDDQLMAGATYLQLAAVDRLTAEVFIEVLHRKDFPSLIAPGPDQNTFRVLVGPASDEGAYHRLRSGLERIGFTSFIKRYRTTAGSGSTGVVQRPL